MKSKLLKNCRILFDDKLIERHLYLEDEKIAYISDEIIAADEVFDLRGLIVIPGLIDCHVHMREPGLTNKEDFLSGSMACAKGGITSFIDMPNTLPPTTTAALLDEKRKLAQKSAVNYGFHFGTTGDNLKEIGNVKNIASVKIYLNTTTGNLSIDDFGKVEKVLETAPFCALHAEDAALQRAIIIGAKLNKRFYACHVSSAQEIMLIRKSKKRPFVEVTPHHLFLNEEFLQREPMLGKVKPGLKTKQDADALWKAIADGIVDTIATDHAPHLADEKLKEDTFGFPGVETLLPLLLDAVNKDRITLQKVIELTSKNPARIFRIKNRGQIEEGFFADLTAVDMELEQEVRASGFLSKSKWSPFEGKLLKGWPVYTFVNGSLVFEKGNIKENKGKELIFEPIAKRQEANKQDTVDKLGMVDKSDTGNNFFPGDKLDTRNQSGSANPQDAGEARQTESADGSMESHK